MSGQVQVWRGGSTGQNPMMGRARLDSKPDFERFARLIRMNAGFREDAGQTMAFARMLEHIMAKVYEAQYPQYKAYELFPLNTEVEPGALTFTYRMTNRIGRAAVINTGNAKDLPNVDVEGEEWQSPIITLGDSYDFTVIDQASAMKAQIAIEAAKAKAARSAIEQLEESIACTGYAGTGVSGVTNAPGVAQVAQTSIANGNWAAQIKAALATSATSTNPYPAVGAVSAIVADIIACKQQIYSQTLGAHNATHALLPPNLWMMLDTMPQSPAYNGLTCLGYIEQLTGLILDDWSILQNAGSISTGSGSSIATAASSFNATRVFVYEKNPDVMQLVVAQPFTQLAPQQTGLVLSVPCFSRVGGAMSVQPLGAVYLDGV